LAFKKRGRKPFTRILSKDTLRLLTHYRLSLVKDLLADVRYRKRLQRLNLLLWSASELVTKISKDANCGEKICVI
jgi:hypothetical protein